MPTIPLIQRAENFNDNTAIIDEQETYSYRDLLEGSKLGAAVLATGASDLEEARVAFLVSPGFHYVVTQWSIWRAGGVAVPLCLKHPLPELEYVLDDTASSILVVEKRFEALLAPAAAKRNIRLVSVDKLATGGASVVLPAIDENRRAMILYTSGTTSKPKGVVTTHANLTAQMECLVKAWGWSQDDEILHVLPLHHTHGIVNVLLCAQWSGARCRMLPGFDAGNVWDSFKQHPLTLFMAVPTIYARLIQYWDHAPASERVQLSDSCKKFRLMVSGSAALPVSVLQKWEMISGLRLLERYGMTEIGMALSNPLDGERRPGSVGRPLPGVELRLVNDAGAEVAEEGQQGEVQIKGATVFLEYWDKPEATAEAFENGWFLTGDIAVKENGYYRLLGRNSVDIIKTGGYKVSALEIEEVLRTHPEIKECAVIGVADEEWGERVCAGVVGVEEHSITLDLLRAWARERLAPYKIPSRILMLDDLPRNVMGKVTKPALKDFFEAS